MIGGATVIGIGPKDRYVTPDMARIGDIVILTKGRPSKRPACSPSPFRARGGTVREKAAREARRSSGRCPSSRTPSLRWRPA